MLRTTTFLLILYFCSYASCEDGEEITQYVTKCETCRILAIELQEILSQAKGMHYAKPTYSFEKMEMVGADSPKRSVIPLNDAVETVCHAALKYNLHKERVQGTRFDKKKTGFFQSLDEMVARGVKVDIGIPHELWGSPTAESRELQLQCERLIEDHEDKIEQWYFDEFGTTSLEDYLCKGHLLKEEDQTCFLEVIEKTEDKKTEPEEEEELEEDEEEEEEEIEESKTEETVAATVETVQAEVETVEAATETVEAAGEPSADTTAAAGDLAEEDGTVEDDDVVVSGDLDYDEEVGEYVHEEYKDEL